MHALRIGATPDTRDIRTRIIDAVVSAAAATGLRKLSMDEIARSAGVGRATLYKYFPGRDALIAAAVDSELAAFFAEVAAVRDRHDDQDDQLIHGFAHAYRLLRHHPALQAVLRLNPTLLLPYLITDASPALDFGRFFVESATHLDETVPAATRAQFAEQVARAFHTLILIPTTTFDLDAPEGPENYARNFLLPVKDHLLKTAAEH
ncbi:TetR/AcrR family transcriptional regulator [Nocardia sp. NPDC127579]|uniref:TetR/AcrR family transcriptional regulator n=1 Tax=Nocardia sp. NPDC127579 TaxID=3345402 RepID=UPI003629498A